MKIRLFPYSAVLIKHERYRHWKEGIATYLRKCAPSKDSDQPAHSRSLIRIFTDRILIAKDATFLGADKEDSKQTASLRRLVQVFAVRNCPKVFFRTFRLEWYSGANLADSFTSLVWTLYLPYYSGALTFYLSQNLAVVPAPRLKNFFSTAHEISLLINIVGIFIFISRENFMLSCV